MSATQIPTIVHGFRKDALYVDDVLDQALRVHDVEGFSRYRQLAVAFNGL